MDSFFKDLESITNPNGKNQEYGEEDDTSDVTRAQLVEADGTGNVDVERSSLRKKNLIPLEIIDPKYKGKIIKKKEAFQDDQRGEESDDVEDGEDRNEAEYVIEYADLETESGNQEGSDDEEECVTATSGNEPDKASIALQQMKGRAIQNQMKLWDQLMATRIKMQKLLTYGNRLPQTDEGWALLKNDSQRSQCQTNINKLLNNLLHLQELNYSKDDNLKELIDPNKKKKTKECDGDESDDEGDDGKESDGDHDDEEASGSSDLEDDEGEDDGEGGETDGDEEDEAKEDGPSKPKRKRRTLKECQVLVEKRHEAYRDHRDNVLMKWFDKTRLASRNGSRKGLEAMERNVVKQIHQIMSNPARLTSRTKTKRSAYSVFGKEDSKNEEEDEEIFDDDDFYQQLLREVIERKSTAINDPTALSRQYLEIQKLRKKTARRQIDTKASKGRKIRYDVHQKLVSYMGAVEGMGESGRWNDEAVSQLFSSLFQSASI